MGVGVGCQFQLAKIFHTGPPIEGWISWRKNDILWNWIGSVSTSYSRNYHIRYKVLYSDAFLSLSQLFYGILHFVLKATQQFLYAFS